jgi:hypothetical protein
VLAYTAATHCPDWTRQITEITDLDYVRSVAAITEYESEAHRVYVHRLRSLLVGKVVHWVQAIQDAPDGARVMLIDCDTYITRPLGAIWETDFDVAYTARDPERSPYPINSGVIAARVSEPVREFFRTWLRKCGETRADSEEQKRWRTKRFGATDQAVFYSLIQANTELRIAALQCREWNCENSEWGRFDPSVTRIVHVKSQFREAIAGKRITRKSEPVVIPLVRQWELLEGKALRWARTSR